MGSIQFVNGEYLNLLSMTTEEELQAIMDKGESLVLKKNKVIFERGQDADTVYIVRKGRVKITTTGEDDKEVLKSLIHRGELLGEAAIFGERLRKDHASAMDDGVELIAIHVSDMRAIMADNPEFSFKITSQIAQKLRSAEKRLEALTFQNSRTRIIEFLKDTAKRQGKKIGYETLLRPFLTHQDIGNLTTTSRQTVSAVLNELKGANKIYYDRHRLLIRDISGL